MNEFLPDVTGFIQEKELLPRGCPVVVGVSGGADSLALLLILNGLRQAHDLVLQVAHLNHGLRGAEADEDEAFVRGWSRKLGIVCVVRRIDIRAKAREERKASKRPGEPPVRLSFPSWLLPWTSSWPVPVGRRHESPWDTI